MAKVTICILPTKTRGCAAQSPETDENDENGGLSLRQNHRLPKTPFSEGKSAINLSNLGNFAKFGPGPFIYVRPVGGPENDLC